MNLFIISYLIEMQREWYNRCPHSFSFNKIEAEFARQLSQLFYAVNILQIYFLLIYSLFPKCGVLMAY